jgi:hypothetical protein
MEIPHNNCDTIITVFLETLSAMCELNREPGAYMESAISVNIPARVAEYPILMVKNRARNGKMKEPIPLIKSMVASAQILLDNFEYNIILSLFMIPSITLFCVCG